MFAIPFNFPFRKKDGSITTIESAIAGGGTDLDLTELDDVAIENPVDGELFEYDGTTGKWKNSSAIPDKLDDEIEARAKLGAHNRCPFPYASGSPFVSRDITFTYDSDGVINADGTNDNTNPSNYILFGGWASSTAIVPPGKYNVSTKTSNADVSIVLIYNETTLATIVGEGVVDAPDGISYAYVSVAKNKTVSDEKIEPLITVEEDTSKTFGLYTMTNRELTQAVEVLSGTSSLPGTIRRVGDLVVINMYAWYAASGFTIPSGFRPKNNTMTVCEQKDAGGTATVQRITIKTDGTVQLSGSNTDFIVSVAYLGE